MQNIIAAMLGLLLSVSGSVCAQEMANGANQHTTPEARLFGIPAFSFTKNFFVGLGHGNQMEVELADISHLARFGNIDSLLLVLVGDLKDFRDSLSDPMTTKHIDYLIDITGQKKLRLRQSAPVSNVYLLDDSGPARLRLEQDTIFIIVQSPDIATGKAYRIQYDRIGFFLNRYDELESYIGSLNGKIRLLEKSKGAIWEDKTLRVGGPGMAVQVHRQYLRGDTSISQDGYAIGAPHVHDQLQLNGWVNAQNYKNYFTPSFALGAAAHIHNGVNTSVYGVYWEPLFFFHSNAGGRLQTYRNDLLVLNYSFNSRDESGNQRPPVNSIGFGWDFSLGYVIGSRGDFFPAHTFRINLGGVKTKNFGRLEPVLYFNNFFKGVTPGIRLSLGGF
jgi:hypothetical protein